jgi:hypothetical protein
MQIGIISAAGRKPSGIKIIPAAGRKPSGIKIIPAAGRKPSGIKILSAAGREPSGIYLKFTIKNRAACADAAHQSNLALNIIANASRFRALAFCFEHQQRC